MKSVHINEIGEIAKKWREQKGKQVRYIPPPEILGWVDDEKRNSLILRNGTIVDDLIRYLSALDKCGTEREFSVAKNGDMKITRVNSCNHGKTCKLCNNRAALARRDIIKKAEKGLSAVGADNICMLTFTMKNVPDIYTAITDFKKSWRKWYKTSAIYQHIQGGVKSIEIKRGSGSGLHHVHAHCLVWADKEIDFSVYDAAEKKRIIAATIKKHGRKPDKNELRPAIKRTTTDVFFEEFCDKLRSDTSISYYKRKNNMQYIHVPAAVRARYAKKTVEYPLSAITEEWYKASGAINLKVNIIGQRGKQQHIDSAIAETLKYALKTSEYQDNGGLFCSAADDLLQALDAVKGLRQVEMLGAFRAVAKRLAAAAAAVGETIKAAAPDLQQKFFRWTNGSEYREAAKKSGLEYNCRYEEITERRIQLEVWRTWRRGCLSMRSKIVGKYLAERADIKNDVGIIAGAVLVDRTRRARLMMESALAALTKKIRESQERLGNMYGTLNMIGA